MQTPLLEIWGCHQNTWNHLIRCTDDGTLKCIWTQNTKSNRLKSCLFCPTGWFLISTISENLYILHRHRKQSMNECINIRQIRPTMSIYYFPVNENILRRWKSAIYQKLEKSNVSLLLQNNACSVMLATYPQGVGYLGEKRYWGCAAE